VNVYGLRLGVALTLGLAVLAACSDAGGGTEVSAVVAPDFSYEGLEPGDAVPGATLRLSTGNTVVLEAVLNDTGSVRIAPDPGTYDVQVSLDSVDPGCFWGDTVFGVDFPSTPITIEVGFICAGE
jgi:hypothetical protein